MDKKLFDLECYKNYFCCGIKSLNLEERIFFEISEEKNDLDYYQTKSIINTAPLDYDEEENYDYVEEEVYDEENELI